MRSSPHLKLAKRYWEDLLSVGDVAIDATCGNGHDTLFLAKKPLSYLLAIDIQLAALESAKTLLKTHLSEEEQKRVIFTQASHEKLDQFHLPAPPRLIVYNLGFLPGGDTSVTTKTESTIASISSALSILAPLGAVSITCYPGHEEGKKEEEALLHFARSLSQTEWEVCFHRWINKPPLSPNLL